MPLIIRFWWFLPFFDSFSWDYFFGTRDWARNDLGSVQKWIPYLSILFSLMQQFLFFDPSLLSISQLVPTTEVTEISVHLNISYFSLPFLSNKFKAYHRFQFTEWRLKIINSRIFIVVCAAYLFNHFFPISFSLCNFPYSQRSIVITQESHKISRSRIGESLITTPQYCLTHGVFRGKE